ncbi:MAG: hypothetical protein DHS20C01_11820 [marine bacterium B5-7]|nr:MAG: hypothetical protein DHS20C01_11820 [marine bacterium B5-7]
MRLACQTRPEADLAITPLVSVGKNPGRTLSLGGVQGSEQQVVCMFVDMRDSTRLGESTLPYDVVFILNQFFVELSVALEATEGHYAQFAGDGLMALYGVGQDDMAQAARMALLGAASMFDRLDRLNERLEPEFSLKIRMGIGIHTGTTIVGRMGPPGAPVLTAIGDNINIAARLESASKIEACDLIVSNETLTALAHGSLDGFQLDRACIEVRGREGGIDVARLHASQLAELAQRLR